MQYSMTCSCGHVMSVDGETRDEAVQKMKDMMTEDAVAAHMNEKHPGEPPMSQAQVHSQIEQGLQLVAPAGEPA